MHRPRRSHARCRRRPRPLARGRRGRRRLARRATSWNRISGPTQPGAQLGLARTADGVLHVIWNRGATPTSIFETRLSAAGKTLGTSTVASRLERERRACARSSCPTGRCGCSPSGTDGINTFTAPSAGRSWTAAGRRAWGGAVAEASGVIGATLTKDGQPVTAWRGNAAEGVPPARFPQNGYEGGMARIVPRDRRRDRRGRPRRERRTPGRAASTSSRSFPAPGRASSCRPLAKDWSVSSSGRIGAAGVFVANADGKSVRLYRYRGSSKTLATGPYFSAAVCAGPGGRLWVAWGDATTASSSPARTAPSGAFEPVQKLAAPSSAGLTFVQCEGSAGPLDLFADDGTGFWHTHVLAQLAVHAA